MSKVYSKEEIEFLKQNVGFMKLTTIAKKLNRPFNSVSIKVNRLGIGDTRTQTGMITLGELAKILFVDRKTIENWVVRHELPCVKQITRQHKQYYFIKPGEFWEWAKKNKEKISFYKIEKNLLAPEPEWVDKERAKKQDRIVNYRAWTIGEKRKVIELKNNGYTFAEIGKMLGRSASSVGKQYYRMKED
ncbi:DNA-binding protein [Ferdinandcohnia sp. SAFN-114]|uniref:DNA-binding protein n=1 Tax=Ferdinandcohnia sp. SAFN-114 TaxID=3387275 RepID=UPI003F7D9332